MDYKKTLNLPQTEFPMRASLSDREPTILQRWKKDNLSRLIQDQGRLLQKRFILHDGPPYANGHVHLGTALNKILKDFVIKSRTMMGQYAPFVPGWDCHGMPIEHNVIKDLGDRAATMTKLEIRRRCRAFADEFVSIQREEFQRLGCLGDWEHPYITMSYQYEAEIMATLGDLVKGGYLIRGLRPIHWCATCKTALAEAELEYHEHSSPSIYVKFPIRPGDPKAASIGLNVDNAAILIWTTTPWTIPANLAIALHPEFDYVFARFGNEVLLVAEALAPSVAAVLKTGNLEIVLKKRGAELEGIRCRHPMYDRDSLVVLADYVTLDTGTGCVHTAPGHGAEDFETGRQYGLPILAPVDEAGNFTVEVPGYAGKNVFACDIPISDELQRTGYLLARQEISHSYPFCWRCKQPLIFRATEQWFLEVDRHDLRKRALEEIERVTWIPAWGHDRIANMVAARPDWCLSRQRAWGVPIPALYCQGCEKAILDPAVIEKTRNLVAESGSDIWFEKPVEAFLPDGFACQHCGGKKFRKEEDILDVWFDSSVSHRAVLEHHDELTWPCDLYLEASDQHRGWFQVSLLTAVATRGKAPYRQVLTHGLILDEAAKKMSKSLGNVIAPEEIISEFGADVLRLLFASIDYTADVCFTRGMVAPISDAYRKIRNTIRFMLGNLSDFNPDQHSLPETKLAELDRWILARLRQVVRRVCDAYAAYEFHIAYRLLLDVCTVDLSAFYLDIIKDRLYVEDRNGHNRRSAQTALYRTTLDLLTMLAPIVSFTADEAWGFLPAAQKQPSSVHLAQLPLPVEGVDDAAVLERWNRLRKVRSEMNKALEIVRKAGSIGSSLDAELTLAADAETVAFLRSFGSELLDVVKVADFTLDGSVSDQAFVSSELPGLSIEVKRATTQKCARCWNRRPEVGSLSQAPDLCRRCNDVVQSSR